MSVFPVWGCILYAHVSYVGMCFMCPCVICGDVSYMPMCHMWGCVLCAHVSYVGMCLICPCVLCAIKYVIQLLAGLLPFCVPVNVVCNWILACL